MSENGKQDRVVVTEEMRERERLFSTALRKVQEGITTLIMTAIVHERVRQEVKWGEQNHPIGNGYGLHLLCPAEAQAKCEQAAEEGNLTWAHILVEEVAEALGAETEDEQRDELIQVAAVAAAAIECIDRKRLQAKIEIAQAEEHNRRQALTEEERQAEDDAIAERERQLAEAREVDEFTLTVSGKTEVEFDVARPKDHEDPAAWEKQVRGEVMARCEASGMDEIEIGRIKPVPTDIPAIVTVYGHSDDCIEIEGTLREEFGHDTEKTLVAFSDRTVLAMTYDGTWTIEVVNKGEAEVEITKADGDRYTDRAVLTFPNGVRNVRSRSVT